MSSFRNHRVVIASLFLPSTAVLGESPPPTPTPELHTPSATEADPNVTIPAVSSILAAATDSKKPVKPTIIINKAHSRQASFNAPLKSIVDDLKDKSRFSTTPAALSPSNEAQNPFSKLTRFAVDQQPSPRKHQTTHSDTAPRIRRTRSSSRRATSSVRSSGDLALTQKWHMEPNPHCNGGLKNAVDSVGDRMRKKLWVGTLGTTTDDFDEDLRKDIDSRMSQRSHLPVWIPDAEFQSCYDEFCHQVLWPCLHYAVPDAPKTKMFYESASYKQYVAVNQRFADAIIDNFQEGDIIWVNDYHLLLLPTMLRLSPKIPPTTPIGFFMHVAFPSSEIFRCLSVRKDLLRGMLGADVVGFQTTNFARHWRQTVSRILSFEALPRGIQVPEGEGLTVGEVEKPEMSVRDGAVERGRFVDVGVFPMGIDVKQLHARKQESDVAEWVQVLKQRYAGMKILVGRDKLDEIQGVRHKLTAFEMFLERHPSFQGQVVLIQVALQTTETSSATTTGSTTGAVTDVVSRINSRFSTLTYQPVVFLHTQDLTFSQYLALLKVADAFIVTSLREGMALRTHEFVECQEGTYRPLILSEFTGSYSYSGFRSCIAVNPWDARGTAEAILQALTMSEEEAKSRWEDLHNHVTTQTAQAFVNTFLNRCVRSNTEHTASLSDDLNASNIVTLHPQSNLLLSKYKHSQKRVIFVDFEGTLWSRDLSKKGVVGASQGFDTGKTEEDLPPLPEQVEEAISVLGKLAEDRKNEVWLLSGLRIKGVLERVAKRIPKVGIVAENGCFMKTRSVGSFGGDWINMVSNFNLTWKNACLEILNYFTERTPGAFIEEREASMVWRYWTADSEAEQPVTGKVEPVDEKDKLKSNSTVSLPATAKKGDVSQAREWALRQAAEAQNHIFDSLGERYGLRIIPGRNSFLVLPNNVSRSTAVGAILHPGGPARPRHGSASGGGSGSWIAHSDSTSGSFSPVFGPADERGHAFAAFTGGYNPSGGGGDNNSGVDDLDFLLAVSSDEKLLRRLSEFDGAETVSTSGKGTDAKWKLESEEAPAVLRSFVAGA